MQKTKLGISVGLFGAALYFMGLVNVIPLVIMVGYVWLFEENPWLKKTAIKAIGVVVFFTILSALTGLASTSTAFLNNIVSLFDGNINIAKVNTVIRICDNVVAFLRSLTLLLAGFKALSQGNVNVMVVDKVVDKHTANQ